MNVPILQGFRILLRPYSKDDADTFRQLVADPRVMHHTEGPIASPDATRLFERLISEDEAEKLRAWAVIRKSTEEYIGHVALKPARDDSLELLILLGHTHWGDGMATEAAVEVLKYAFETAECPMVFSTVDPGHKTSIRVLEKIGMRVLRWDRDEQGPYPVYAIDRRMWKRKLS